MKLIFESKEKQNDTCGDEMKNSADKTSDVNSHNEMNKCPYSRKSGLGNELYYPTATRDVTSKQMDGISDLVVWAPIKEGFVDAFGNVTYESRLRIVAEALNKLRRNVREFQDIAPFADSTRRILSLLDFRIGIVERDIFGFGDPEKKGNEELRPRKYMYLTATFDGPWEPYMRQIWHPMGAFLDLVLCNCEDYLPATRTPFEQYVQWVRDHSLDTGMFYLVMGQTVKDHIYLEDLERIQRDEKDPLERDKAIATLSVTSPDASARQTRRSKPVESLKLALEALNVLYQLTRYYPQNSDDENQENFLLSATKQILEEKAYSQDLGGKKLKQFIKDRAKAPIDPRCECETKTSCESDDTSDIQTVCKCCRESKKMNAILVAMKDQLDWYDQDIVSRQFESCEGEPRADDSEIQKGILSSYDDGLLKNTHGSVLLLKITDLEKVKRLLDPNLWSWEGDQALVYRNISITNYGLAKLPLTEQEQKAFPKEFREGMEARATLMGDMHSYHPQKWPLPKRFNKDDAVLSPLPPVSMTEVDLVVQLRGNSFLNPNADASSRIVEPFIEFGNNDKALISFNVPNLGTLSQLIDDKGLTQIHDDSSTDEDRNKAAQAELEDFLGLPQSFDSASGDFKKIIDSIVEVYSSRSKDNPTIMLVDVIVAEVIKHQDWLGIEVLSIENSTRPGVLNSPTATPSTQDHFQFEDGISQPNISDLRYNNEETIKKSRAMDIARGDLIYGFSNLLGDVTTPNLHKKLQINGSFLAMRKISQDVGAFNKFFETNGISDQDIDNVAAKLMGRERDGTPLIKPTHASDPLNGFKYKSDPDGIKCPFASHIRRANPREVIHNHKTPKILRRGMSYGHRFEEDSEGERGILFMAYCSNLAEQYEVIQRWVNGGNSSHVGSAQTDPLFAPMPVKGDYTIKYAEEDGQKNINVRRLVKTEAFTTLEWGLYAFVPAKKSLSTFCEKLSKLPAERYPVRSQRDYNANKDLIDRIERGRRIIEDINRLGTDDLKRHYWKVIFEDFLTKDPSQRDVSNDVWAYITAKCDGIYRIECGVNGHNSVVSETPVILITDKAKICDAWAKHDIFSNEEIGERLTTLFANHYIGRDPSDPIYAAEAVITNQALLDYSSAGAYQMGYAIGKGILDARKCSAEKLFETDEFKIELSREYFAPALAILCEKWFGITKTVMIDEVKHQFFESGAFDADENAAKVRLARCPGDFLATSRSSFYPRPTEAIWKYGEDHGQRLKLAIDQLIQTWKANGQVEGIITQKIFNEMKGNRSLKQVTDEEFDLLGRNIIGAMIGMLPSSEASLRGAIFEWLDQDLLWRIQGDCFSKSKGKDLSHNLALETIVPHLKRSMSKRPAPDLLHRTVKEDAEFEGVKVRKGETVMFSLISAMMTDLENHQENTGYLTVFGGNRSNGDATIGENPHACPARGMAMGYLPGILAALLQSGRITALPASLIFKISEWDKKENIESD